MTLQEWKAQLGRGPGTPAPAPVASAPNADAPSTMYHPTSGDDYVSAAEHELLRTGKEAAIGLARSPLDLVKSFLHPIDTVTGMARAVRHPVDAAKALIDSPRDAGSVLGQMLIAPKLPGAAETAVAEGPGVVGRGMGAVGRGMETAGTSKVAKLASRYGPMEAALRMDPYGLAVAAAPKVLEVTGKGLQKGGAALEGLDLSLKRPLSKMKAAMSATPEEAVDPEAATVRETVNTARGYQADGASGAQAAQRAGWPLGKSEEIPYRAGSGADVAGARGPEQAAANESVRALQKLVEGDSKWASDASAQPVPPEKPIEQFYRTDPAARNDFDGVRTTGRFEEGPGGLSDVAAGSVEPHLSPLDALARLSKAHPMDEVAMLKRFKDWEVQ